MTLITKRGKLSAMKKRPGMTTLSLSEALMKRLKELAHPGQTPAGVIQELIQKVEAK